MTAQAKLTETQTNILKAAAKRVDGNIEPLLPNLRGGARTKVIEGLLARGLAADADGHILLTDDGYAAVGKRAPSRRVSRKLTPQMPSRNASPSMHSRNWRPRRPPFAPAPSWPRSSMRCATPAARPSPR